jgi:hypothetical protein
MIEKHILEKRQRVGRFLQSVLFSKEEFQACGFVAALWVKNIYMIITENPVPIALSSVWSTKLDISELENVVIQFYSAVESDRNGVPTLEIDDEIITGEIK